MMDIDLDFSLNPSGTIYGARAIRLDPVTANGCYAGNPNARCIGISQQGTEFAPGMIGNTTLPLVLAQAGDGSKVAVYGPGRRCLIEIDPAFGGQIAPNDLIISATLGYGTKATPTGPWNQWIIGIALSFANQGQCCNVKVVIFPWTPTGS